MTKRLSCVLAAFACMEVHMGDEIPHKPDVQDFQTKLGLCWGQARTYLAVLVTMLVVVFLVAIGLTALYSRNPKALTLITAASGVSVSLVLNYMNRIWKDVVLINILVTLPGYLDTETVRTVVRSILTESQKK